MFFNPPSLSSCLLLHFYSSSVAVSFGFSSSFSVWTLSLSVSGKNKHRYYPCCSHSPYICCNWDLDHPTQGWKKERDRQGPISISALAWLSGAPGRPRELIWRRFWELGSYLSRFIGEEWFPHIIHALNTCTCQSLWLLKIWCSPNLLPEFPFFFKYYMHFFFLQFFLN